VQLIVHKIIEGYCQMA